ncbi:MAG TPA: DUF4129 domain-containing protein [Micromonosporaceae bacterium]
MAAVLALLSAAMLSALFANPTIPLAPPQDRPARSAPATPSAAAANESMSPTRTPRIGGDPSAELPRWLTWAITVVCGTAVLAVVIGLLYVMRPGLRRRDKGVVVASASPPQLRRQALADLVEAGLVDLDDGDEDPRRAIIACWVRLEQAAAAAGTPRDASDTSTDLVVRLLHQYAVSPAVLARLAEIYREARFAPHPVGTDMREQARAALRQVRDELLAAVR